MSYNIFLYRFSRIISILGGLSSLKIIEVFITENTLSSLNFLLLPFGFIIIFNWMCFGEITIWIDSKYGK